jgi:hypothetical protein
MPGLRKGLGLLTATAFDRHDSTVMLPSIRVEDSWPAYPFQGRAANEERICASMITLKNRSLFNLKAIDRAISLERGAS